MLLNLYVVDSLMVIAALGSVVSAAGEVRRQPIGRWRLLMPGAFALLATVLMIAFPTMSDLFDVGFWTVLVVSILVGVVRGAFIGMASDHYWSLVRLDQGVDALLAALGVLLVAIVQFAIEVSTGAENRAETTFEFAISVISGYLLGRSIAAWFRARALHHHDLKEV
jgi:cation transport ATPase